MPRSTTVWAAALVLASFSGIGPMLTTAEAMPAPGPQQTQGRPMYYFPRHVKRQIVTNHTEPALPTPSPPQPPKLPDPEPLTSRQSSNFNSFVNSLFHPDPETLSSSAPSNGRNGGDTTSVAPSPPAAVTTLPQVPVSSPPPSPDDSVPPPPVQTPIRESTSKAPEVVITSDTETPPRVGTSSDSPLVVVQPTSAVKTLISRSDINDPLVGSTSGSPDAILSPTSAAPASSPSQPSNPDPLSSILDSLVGSTGVLPIPVVQPTPSAPTPDAPVSSQPSGQSVGSTGDGPNVIVPSTPAPVSSAPPQSTADASSFVGPFIVSASTAAQVSSGPAPADPTPTPAIVSTGGLPISVVLPSSLPIPLPSDLISSLPIPLPSDPPLLSLPSSGIVVGITTAFGTGDATPTPTAPILTSDADATPPASSGLPDLPAILSSIVSELPGITPSDSGLAVTAPTPTPTAVLPPVLSSIISDIPDILSSLVSELPPSAIPTLISDLPTPLPTPSAAIPISSLPPFILSTGVLPSSDIVLPSSAIVPPISVTPVVTPTPIVTPSQGGILPSSGMIGTSAVAGPTPSASASRIPASEGPASSIAPVQSSASLAAPVSGSATVSNAVTPSADPNNSNSATLAIPTIPSSKPSPVVSLAPTGTDSRTAMLMPSSIIQVPSTQPSPTSTPSSIPAALPKLIVPAGGLPTDVPQDSFMGQICFNYQLNYEFVWANDGGDQIFHYLPIAISDALNINVSDVKNYGLKAYDTLKYQGFITTVSLFTIPKDLESTLTAQLHNPMDTLWHNKDPVVNSLTDLINTACPLPAGKTPPDINSPNVVSAPVNPSSGGDGDGGALGGDIGASRKVNSTSAIVASSAIVGAIAYGAAMFFVARRYRNKRIAHQRTSSVPNMSRMTYGSIPGGPTAWMHGARNGRMTPGSRGSQGSSSTQGHSIRTQQISAPVNAENSLGWN